MKLEERLNKASVFFAHEYFRIFALTKDRYQLIECPASESVILELKLAIDIINYFKSDKIEELIKSNIVDKSIIEGRSLLLAENIYNSWKNKSLFRYNLSADDSEQLYRICDSAKKIITSGSF